MQGVFPDELKLAKVIPLYKRDNPMSIINYRPISILPVLSTILEILICNQLIDFLDRMKLYTNFNLVFGINIVQILLLPYL